MEPEELNPLGQLCTCVKNHDPGAFVPTHHHIIPQSWGGPTTEENMIWLCPNTHTAVHRLIDNYIRYGGLPPWEVRQHFTELARDLAQRAWDNRPENPTYTSLEYEYDAAAQEDTHPAGHGSVDHPARREVEGL